MSTITYGPEEEILKHADIAMFRCECVPCDDDDGGAEAPSSSFGLRGFKTSFNVEYLKSVGGQYDKAAKVWRFSDESVAHAAAMYIISKSADAVRKKQDTLPAFRPKKMKTAVLLDPTETGLEHNNNNNNNTENEPPKRKRKETASSRKKNGTTVADAAAANQDGSDANDEEDQPIRALTVSSAKKARLDSSHTNHVSDHVDVFGEDMDEDALIVAASASSSAASAKTKAKAAPRKKKQVAPFPPLVRLPDPGRREDWEVTCAIADVKELDPSDFPCESPPPRAARSPHTPPPRPHKAGAAAHRATLISSFETDEETTPPLAARALKKKSTGAAAAAAVAAASASSSSATSGALTRDQWEVVCGVGAACTMDITFRVGWKEPSARELSHTSHWRTESVPCTVTSFEIDASKRLDVWVRPTEPHVFENLTIAGPIETEIHTDDDFRFRQKFVVPRTADIRAAAPLEVISSPLWKDASRDPLHTIECTLRL